MDKNKGSDKVHKVVAQHCGLSSFLKKFRLNCYCFQNHARILKKIAHTCTFEFPEKRSLGLQKIIDYNL